MRISDWSSDVCSSDLRTRSGQHLLAVGEAPCAAASAGLRIDRTQTMTLLVAGMFAGFGGGFHSVGDLGLFSRNMTVDGGWSGFTAALIALNPTPDVVLTAAVSGFGPVLEAGEE